eukprot:scpid35403/ scgid26072/ Endothelin-converting enzyme 1
MSGKKSYSQLDDVARGDQESLSSKRRSGCSYSSATTLERWLALVLVVAVLSILGLAIYIGIDRARHHKNTPQKSNPCTSQDCVVFAGEIAATLNKTADPCEDFYEYACGGFVATHIRPDDVGRLSSFSALSDKNFERLRQELVITPKSHTSAVGKASLMYETCLQLAQITQLGAAPLLSFIASIGGLPVISSASWNPDAWNFEDVVIEVQQRSNAAGFMSISIEQDAKNTEDNLFHIYSSGLGLRSKTYYSGNSTTNFRYLTAYRKEMKAVFVALGATDADATQAVQEIVDLETRVAAIQASLTELRDPESTYNKWTVSQLQSAVPAVDWLKIMKGVLAAEVRDRISNDTYIIVQWPAYMMGLSELLDDYKTNKTILANYMTWISIKSTLVHLGPPILSYVETFQRETAGTEPRARSHFCVSTTDRTLGYATGRLFVDKYFSPATRTAATEMIENIRKAFLDNLPSVVWMDEQTRIAAAEKAKAVRKLVGYADFIKNNTALNDRYKDLLINETCHYCNHLAGIVHKNRRNYAKLFKPVELEFGMTAATVNAYYEGTENVIVFPAGILQPTFYYSTGPDAMNYGGIGAVVGHELTHGFDDKGRQFDKQGNLHPWWSETSIKNFEKRASCIASQYSEYTVFGEHVSGNQTLGENIADHGGLKMAYKAYQQRLKTSADMTLPGVDLTLDQLFFVSFARTWCSITSKANALARLRTDVHSPTNFRVLGTVSDDENFARAFNCRKGSAMNPEHQCLLW